MRKNFSFPLSLLLVASLFHSKIHADDGLICDWLDTKSEMEEEGISFDGSLIQFYQGISSGGIHEQFRYGGHADYNLDFDFEKLSDWEGFRLELGAEHRFGDTVNRSTGSIIPVALNPNLPEPETYDVALTKVLFTQELEENWEVFFGKIDSFDLDANEFADGNGGEKFFCTAFNYDPVATRSIPFSTLGAGLGIVSEGERIFTLVVMNSEDTATTSGFDELFADGAVIIAQLRLPVQFNGRDGHQMIAGSYSSRTFKTLGQDGRVQFPDVAIDEKKGTWGIYYAFDQFIWQDPHDSSRGWGLFGRAALSDGNPNPIEWFLSLGIGGKGMIQGREKDTFGIGWYYTGISDDFKTITTTTIVIDFDPIVTTTDFLDDGQGIELYYSYAVNDHFYITPDLQIVIPNLSGAETAIVPGIRARLDF